MSKIGYIRVSTEHQETARQQEIMDSYQVNRIFSEKISGANKDRPQLKAMLDYVREGDTLYIESISRLGRSTKDLLNIIDTLDEKGVTLVSHKENIDTVTPTGKFMLTVFAALSQLEREQLKQRQREGIEIAKAQGKCETDYGCANRLRAIGAAHSFFRLYSLHQREHLPLQDSHYAHLLP